MQHEETAEDLLRKRQIWDCVIKRDKYHNTWQDNSKKNKLSLINSTKRINNIVLHCLDSSQLILDVNSVHPNLYLSEGNRTATMKNDPKNYPDHPDRFDHWQQVSIY